VNNQLEIVWKEVAMACLERLRNPTETSVRVAGLQAEILNWNHLNVRHEG
jgi:hypothetical protein